MTGNTSEIKTGNKELDAAISNINQHFLKINIDTLESNKDNFKWILISIFFGIFISILLSFNVYLKIIAIFVFFLSSIFFLYIFFFRIRKYKKNIKELREHQEKNLVCLYLMGKISELEMVEYVKLNFVSKKRYKLALKEKLNQKQIPKVISYTKIKIIYKNGKKKILEKAVIDQYSGQIDVFDEKDQLSEIIFFSQEMESIVLIQ